jgi:hypothetical protein
VLDEAWSAEEWIMLPQCQTVKFANSRKSQNSHCIHYVAPVDAEVTAASRKVFRSYTPRGAVTVLRLPRVIISGPGRIDCAEIYVAPFESRIPIPSFPQMIVPKAQDNLKICSLQEQPKRK